MLQVRREAEIVRVLRADGPASVDDLARRLRVSASTVRRDLARLDARGTLQRVHGGAAARDDGPDGDPVGFRPDPAGDGDGDPAGDPDGDPDGDEDRDLPFEQVAEHDVTDKRAIGVRAARLVQDGDVVLLDIGTTVVRLARELVGRPVTVITSSLAVLDVLRGDPSVELIMLGGVVRPSYHSLVGLLTETGLAQVRADLAFLGTSGVRTGGEVLDSTRVEVQVKRSMIAAADRAVLLADRHKFPGSGGLKVCHVRELWGLVTNEGLPEAMVSTCRGAGVEVVLA
jgi:DeoR/GlpR family transcriptional regulator of sugar metabolism